MNVKAVTLRDSNPLVKFITNGLLARAIYRDCSIPRPGNLCKFSMDVFALVFGSSVLVCIGTAVLYALFAVVEPIVLGTSVLGDFSRDTLKNGSYVLALWFMSGFTFFYGAILGVFGFIGVLLLVLMVSLVLTLAKTLSKLGSPSFDKICPPIEYEEDS